jgi:hypothetical protein
MKYGNLVKSIVLVCISLSADRLYAQSAGTDTVKKEYKNVIRYNLSSPVLFGFDKSVIFGYERLVGRNQSFSVNFGANALPRLVTIETDSFSLQRDVNNSGVNFSFDYRFYLPKENKHKAPHGLYLGPFVSYNHYNRENTWLFQANTPSQKSITTTTELSIFTVGAEMGYQFVLWKRMTLDMLLIGPGVSTYSLNAKISGDLSEAQKPELREALKQVITQKFPGMNYVFADKEFNASGNLGTTALGFRYLIHIGFLF